MDFLDPAKKRAHRRRLFISYALIGVIIALTSLILIVLAYGWGVDRSAGKLTIIRNGLVFVSSYPPSADVYVNGENRGNTSLRLSIPSGKYTFELKRSSYRNWKRTVNIDGGIVEQLTYPFLFPTLLITTDTQLYKTPPKLATESPDNNWLIAESAEKFNTFDRYNLSLKTPVAVPFSIPNNLLATASGSHSLAVIEWASDNKHVLMRHNFHGSHEFVVVDIQKPENSININQFFKGNPSSVTLLDKHFDKFYFYDAKTHSLSKADISPKQNKTLINNVLTYKNFGPNIVVYTASQGAPAGKAAVNIWDGKTSYLVNHFNIASGIGLDMDSYASNDYLAISLSTTGLTYIYKNPLQRAKSHQPVILLTVIKLSRNSFTSFSKNSRFIESQYGKNFGVYDIEEGKLYYTTLTFNLPTTNQAKWMDSYRLNLVYGSKTYVFDFDGSNLQSLAKSLDQFLPYFTKDYTKMYNLAPSVLVPKSYALTSTNLKVASP